MTLRAGGFVRWGEDTYLTVNWSFKEVVGHPFFEFAIFEPGHGTNWTDGDPLVEGNVTRYRAEVTTLGCADVSNPYQWTLLQESITAALELGRKKVNG